MRSIWIAIALVLTAGPARAQDEPKPLPPIPEKVAGLQALEGFLPLYWDEREGKLWLEINRWNTELLYNVSLAAGIGSNDIGLDRGQLGREAVVTFERVGPKVLLVEQNYGYRAVTGDAAEQEAVSESFARSVLWGFAVAAEEDGRALVDATDFFLRDAHGVAGQLKDADQGDYKVEASRSAIYLARTKNFPQNTEVEATLTFTGGPAGNWLRTVSPSTDAVTVRLHHSFVDLPGPGYTPRAFDPRAGYFGVSYLDFSTPIHEPIRKRFIARHRLQKQDPNAAVSEAVEPIVYYLDPGTPEPVRSALLDGARWWSEAFEAAGFRNAYRVEMLPAGADPMDIRYNVIQWVHRSTRGWSYGSSVIDPRTGEILKGKVTLGSLRVRQDYLIAEALLGPYESGQPRNGAMEQMALARLRQLSAHEVGHTLGLSHNYIASAAGRASVMDYPHPLVELNAEGEVDLSNAYATGMGEWDKVAIRWGYGQFGESSASGSNASAPGGNEQAGRAGDSRSNEGAAPAADESKELDRILREAEARGIYFLTDADARPLGSAHPANHLWDNGTNAVDELERILKVRVAALARFSEKQIPEGAPMAALADTLVPLYLMHRYQVEAAAKTIGGLAYRYALRGDGQPPARMIPPGEQSRALDAVLATLSPEALEIPEPVLALLPPRPPGYPRTRESFEARTGVTFDALAAAESAADHVASLLLHPERAARLVEYHAREDEQPGLAEVLDRIVESVRRGSPGTIYEVQLERVAELAVLRRLMSLAADEQASTAVQALARNKLREWQRSVADQAEDPHLEAHQAYVHDQITKFFEDPKQMLLPAPAEAPPGQPIGMTLSGRAEWICGWE
jgi:hypothetical protein